MKALISLTCDNEYELFVNEKFLGLSKRWKDRKHFNVELNAENTLIVKCKNLGGAAGLVGIIKYGEKTIVTDNTWECSLDQQNWLQADEVANYGSLPWRKPLFNLPQTTKWIWKKGVDANIPVYFRKSIKIEQIVEKVEILTEDVSLKKFEQFITPNHPAIVEKVKQLNNDPMKCYRFVSDRIAYVTDEENYGKPEYWTYPYETLAKGSGDCEDQAFLIASMFAYLKIECFVRAAYLINYNGGHAWCYFKWANQWLPAECTSSAFDPWNKDKRPQYGPYLPWLDIQIGNSHNYTGIEMLEHTLRIKKGSYTDGTLKLQKEFINEH